MSTRSRAHPWFANSTFIKALSQALAEALHNPPRPPCGDKLVGLMGETRFCIRNFNHVGSHNDGIFAWAHEPLGDIVLNMSAFVMSDVSDMKLTLGTYDPSEWDADAEVFTATFPKLSCPGCNDTGKEYDEEGVRWDCTVCVDTPETKATIVRPEGRVDFSWKDRPFDTGWTAPPIEDDKPPEPA